MIQYWIPWNQKAYLGLDTFRFDSCIYDTVYLLHPQTSVWCSWIINPSLTHLPIHTSVQQLLITFTPHSLTCMGWLFFCHTLLCYLCHSPAQQILYHSYLNLQYCCINFHLICQKSIFSLVCTVFMASEVAITHFSAPQIWRFLTLTRRVSSCMWHHSSACFPKVSPWKPSRRWRRCRGQPQPASAGWPQRSIMRFRPSSASPSRLGTPAPCSLFRLRLRRIRQSSDSLVLNLRKDSLL